MHGFGSSASGASSSVPSVAGPAHFVSGFRSSGTRRRPFSHPATLLILALAVLVSAYALGYGPHFGRLLDSAVRSGQKTALPALSPACYGVGGLIAFLLFLALLRSVDMLLRGIRKPSPLPNRPAKPLAKFLEEAAAAKISTRVAHESYQMLQPYYPQIMSIDLADRLREDLHLEDELVRLLEAKLLTRCDRRDRSYQSVPPDVSMLTTVFDLVSRVEAAGLLPVERPSGVRDRSTDIPAPLPIHEVRNPSSAQRKAIHAAALHAIESRSLRMAETSGLKRRSSDYDGPRRRATDHPAKTRAYPGPFRRSADLVPVQPAASSAERKAAMERATLNQQDPSLVQPRQRRAPEREARN